MLDSANYLTSFGWKGKGSGLRQGSASRPLAIPQKRTLAGVGKDRDEAFPFWDHLFAAAAKSIQIKLPGDAKTGEDPNTASIPRALHRTTTGILSNRRPIVSTPATSGTTTPTDVDQPCAIPRVSLLAAAKRDSARQRLYARFFRGPVIGPEVEPKIELTSSALQVVAEIHHSRATEPADRVYNQQEQEKKAGDESRKKEMRTRNDAESVEAEERKEKRRRQDIKTDHEERRNQHGMKRVKKDQQGDDFRGAQPSKEKVETFEEKRQRKAAKAERRRRKEERRKAKDERREARARRKAQKALSLVESSAIQVVDNISAIQG